MLAILGGTALPVLCLTTLAPLAVARVLACLAARVEHLPEVVQAPDAAALPAHSAYCPCLEDGRADRQ